MELTKGFILFIYLCNDTMLVSMCTTTDKQNNAHTHKHYYSLNNSFEKAGYSRSETQKVLTSIASDVLVDDGQVVNAFEAFWVPGDGNEVLTTRDIIADFPELVTL
jgi:Protein of unknown function (DUF1517)